jgi:RNA polymerase sigma-70 factor (ECF subfamily)
MTPTITLRPTRFYAAALFAPALFVQVWRNVSRWRGWLPMPGNDGAGEPADWAGLIGAVAQAQDRAAFARLFQHFAPRVKGFMRKSGMSDQAAEELAQETLLMVWRKAATFDPASTGPSAWIFTIARNLRIDALRRAHRSVSGVTNDIAAEFVLDDAPAADAVLAAQQDQARMRAAMAALSGDQMQVVELSFYQEKAHAEIATTLGIPLGTVKSRLRLAMDRLRKALDDVS